jgi:hypothetical protein
VTPTRLSTLLGLAFLAGCVGYALLVLQPTTELPPYAVVSVVLLAVVEVGLAKVVRDRVTHRARPGSRPLHPVQVARAAVLAKASSAGGALLAGGCLGVLAWAVPRRDELSTARDDVPVAAGATVASLLLVGAALLLERACRRPDRPDEQDLGSAS